MPRPILATGIGVYVVMLAIGLGLRQFDGLTHWQARTFGAPALTAFLAHGVLTVLAMLVLRVDADDVALNARQPARWLEVACMALAAFGSIGGAAFALVGAQRWAIGGLQAALVLGAAYALSLPLMALVLRKTRPVDTAASPHTAWVVIGLLAAAVLAMAVVAPVSMLAARVVYLLVIVGLGEELFYRGLLQSLFDHWRPPHWTVFGVTLGWGWVVQAVLFGAAHALLSPTPFAVAGWAVWTTVTGLAFGWLRARSGTLLAPALVHGVTDAIGLAVVPALAG